MRLIAPKQSFFFRIYFLLLPVMALARPQITIAVLDFEAKNVSIEYAESVADLLRTELFNTGRFQVVERQKIRRVIEEQQFQMSGLTDPGQAVRIGKLLNVEKILVGSLNRLGRTFILNTRIVDVQSALVVLAEAVECTTGEEGLPSSVAGLALNIAHKVGLEGAVIRIVDDRIYVDIGRVDGIEEAQYLDVIRQGEVITDLEGNVIGTAEEKIGVVQIEVLQDRFAIGRLVQKKMEIRTGDLVQIASGPPDPVILRKSDPGDDEKPEPEKKEGLTPYERRRAGKNKPEPQEDPEQDQPEVPVLF